MYKQIIRPYLFCFKPETAHRMYLNLVRFSGHFPQRYLVRLTHGYDQPLLKRQLFGLDFRNPVGLAGGFDPNGDRINELSNFGFGFVEIGSLSTEPQDGGQKPRLLRFKKQRALVNRLEAKNKGEAVWIEVR